MAMSSMPDAGITLYGPDDSAKEAKQSLCTAILLKLSNGVVQDIKAASQSKHGLNFIAGNAPVR